MNHTETITSGRTPFFATITNLPDGQQIVRGFSRPCTGYCIVLRRYPATAVAEARAAAERFCRSGYMPKWGDRI